MTSGKKQTADVVSGTGGVPSLKIYLKGLLSYYVLDVLRLITFLILTPYLLAYLGDERFGIQLTVVALMGYMGLLDLGLSSVLPKYIAEERGKGNDAKITRLVASGFWTFVLTGIFGFMLTCLGTQHIDFLFRDLMPRFQEEAAWFLILMGLNFMISLPLGILAGVPYAYERIELMNLIKILQLLIWPVAILVTIHWDLGLQGLALGSIAATLAGGIGNLWLSFWLKPDLSLSPRQASAANIRKLFSYGLLFFINGISVVLVFKTDSLVISISLGAGMVTLYAIIADVSQQISMFIFKIGDALFPTYSRLNAAGQHLLLARTFITSLRYTVIIAGLVASFFIVFGVDIFTLWLGRPGEIPVWVVSLFGLIILLHSISHVSGMFVAAMGHLGRIVWWSVVEGGLNLGLSRDDCSSGGDRGRPGHPAGAVTHHRVDLPPGRAKGPPRSQYRRVRQGPAVPAHRQRAGFLLALDASQCCAIRPW